MAFSYPHDGILVISPSGVIRELDAFGRFDNNLRVGDRIESVDGIPLLDAVPFYINKNPGDTVNFIVIRNGGSITLPVKRRRPIENRRGELPGIAARSVCKHSGGCASMPVLSLVLAQTVREPDSRSEIR